MSVAPSDSLQQSVSTRLISIDAYRGFVMICLAADGFGLTPTAKRIPNSPMWKSIGYQFDHVPWAGCAFWDLIQPSFMFLVGVAIPFSFARREASNESRGTQIRHILIRSLTLILLGLFLSSKGTATTNFEFMNVLTQIGLGYPFLFLFRNRGFAIQFTASVIILMGYWAWFALTPVIPVNELKGFNIPQNLPPLSGFELHWQKHTNPAAQFDRWFLNLFPVASPPRVQSSSETANSADGDPLSNEPEVNQSPGFFEVCGSVLRRLVTRPEPFRFNRGGYQTPNCIPSFVTMLFGLMAGEFLRGASGGRQSPDSPGGEGIRGLTSPARRMRIFATLLVAGIALIGTGWVWQLSGTCPLVKRIWTPSWTLYSSGWALVILAGFYGIIDVLGWKSWSFPFVVAGMNSMVLYMLSMLLRGWTSSMLKRHINDELFNIFGTQLAPIVEQCLLLVCFWLFAYWLYRQRIFVRI